MAPRRKPREIELDASAPENFLARVKRVSDHNAFWVRRHHHQLEQTIREHMEGLLSDFHLSLCLNAVAQGGDPPKVPRAADAEVRASARRLNQELER